MNLQLSGTGKIDKRISFSAVIEDAGSGGAFVTIPFDVEKTFGKKRIKIRAWINGEFYRGSLVRMGGEQHILGVRKDIRIKIGKQIGEVVDIELEEDTDPRVVELPADLMEAVDRNLVEKDYFHKLSYTHQKEYIKWIEGARQEKTRKKRIDQIIDMLKTKKTD